MSVYSLNGVSKILLVNTCIIPVRATKKQKKKKRRSHVCFLFLFLRLNTLNKNTPTYALHYFCLIACVSFKKNSTYKRWAMCFREFIKRTTVQKRRIEERKNTQPVAGCMSGSSGKKKKGRGLIRLASLRAHSAAHSTFLFFIFCPQGYSIQVKIYALSILLYWASCIGAGLEG